MKHCMTQGGPVIGSRGSRPGREGTATASLRAGIRCAAAAVMIMSVAASECLSDELKSRYADVIYQQETQLSQFNRRIFPGLSRDTGGESNGVSAREDVAQKIDAAVERIQVLLHACPRDLNFAIVIVATADEVQQYYENMYGPGPKYISFYSPRNRTLVISAEDVNSRILVHELTHAVMDKYFMHSPSGVIQEILAHYVETHLQW